MHSIRLYPSIYRFASSGLQVATHDLSESIFRELVASGRLRYASVCDVAGCAERRRCKERHEKALEESREKLICELHRLQDLSAKGFEDAWVPIPNGIRAHTEGFGGLHSARALLGDRRPCSEPWASRAEQVPAALAAPPWPKPGKATAPGSKSYSPARFYRCNGQT